MQLDIFIVNGLVCTGRCREASWCSKILQIDDNLLIGNNVEILSAIKINLSTQFQMEIQIGRNILQGLRFFGTIRIRKLRYIMYTNKHLVKCMMQDSKEGHVLLGLELAFLKIDVLRHQRRKIAFKWYLMSFQWVALCMRCYALTGYFLYCGYYKQISVKSKSKTLDNCQAYTQVSLENEGLCACALES